MKTILSIAAVLCAAPLFAAEPPRLKEPPRIKGYSAAPCTYCTSCSCAAGVCPACPTAAGSGEVLTTVSGKTIKLVGGVYVYADDEPAKVLDCSSGKCRWVDAPRGAPSISPPIPSYSAPIPAYSSGGCANGQCGSVQSFGRQPKFAFPRK